MMEARLGTGSAPCPPTAHRHPPVCRCGATVTDDDVVVTASGWAPSLVAIGGAGVFHGAQDADLIDATR